MPRAVEYAFNEYMRGVTVGAGDGEVLSTGGGTSTAGGAGVVSFWVGARGGMKVRGVDDMRMRLCILSSGGGDQVRGGSIVAVPEVQLDLRDGTERLVKGWVL